VRLREFIDLGRLAAQAGLDVFGVGEHHRPDFAGVYPRPVQEQFPVWIAMGGIPASVVRAGRHGLPLYLAILGQPTRFARLADLYRQSGADTGQDAATLRVGVTSHFYVEETSQGARDTFYLYYSRYIGDNMPAARGQRLPRDAFDAPHPPREDPPREDTPRGERRTKWLKPASISKA